MTGEIVNRIGIVGITVIIWSVGWPRSHGLFVDSTLYLVDFLALNHMCLELGMLWYIDCLIVFCGTEEGRHGCQREQ